MTTALRFRHHEGFQRAALAMTGAGAAMGAVALSLPLGPAAPLALVGGATIAAAAIASEPSARGVAARAVVALAGAIAMLLLARAGRPDLGFACFAGLAAVALSWGARGQRLVVAIVAAAVAIALARVAQHSVANASVLAGVPGAVIGALGGVAFAAASSFALLSRHIDVVRDPVARAHAEIAERLSGEMAELVCRGNELWKRAAADLEPDDANRALLQEAVLRLLSTASRWSAAEAGSSQNLAASLSDRMSALDDRIAATSDEVVAGQYQQARAALAEQLGYLGGIAQHRDRVLARMHNYLATMERLRLAVVNLRSANAAQAAAEVGPIASSLESLGEDIAACAAALGEVEATTSRA